MRNNKLRKKALAWLLTLTMFLSSFVLPVYADEQAQWPGFDGEIHWCEDCDPLLADGDEQPPEEPQEGAENNEEDGYIDIEASAMLPPGIGQGATPNPPNLARAGTPRLLAGVTNTWQPQPNAQGLGGAVARINNGTVTGTVHDVSWNAHGMAANSRSDIAIEWTTPQILNSMRIRWAFDTVGGTGGVQLPASAVLQYWDGTAWQNVTGMTDGAGVPVTSVGTAGVTGNATATTPWNAVIFDAVETTALRLNITNQGNGAGIFEWEIFGVQDLALADITSLPTDFLINLHQDVVFPEVEHNSTFTFSNSSNPEALSNTGVVTRGEEDAAGTITITATNGEFTQSRVFNFLVLRALEAAEVPNITAQPQSVVVNAANPTATLSVTANVTDAGNLTYQWFELVLADDEDEEAEDIHILLEGQTAPTFVAPVGAAGKFNYYVVITNTNPAADEQVSYIASEVATVEVVPTVTNVVVRPATRIIRYGGSFQFTASVATLADAPEDLTWSIERAEGELAEGTTIVDGLITLSENEAIGQIIVTATAVHDNGEEEFAYGTATVIVSHVDGVRSPNVFHNTFRVHPDNGTDLTAGANVAVLQSFDHAGWHLQAADAGTFGPAGTRNFRSGTGAQGAVFAASTNSQFSPGNFLVFNSSGLFLRRNAGADNSEFAIYNGNSLATNGNIDFGSEFLDVEIHAGHRLTSGAGSIVFRYLDENNFYFLRARAGQPYQLGAVINGEETIIATSGTGGANTMPNNAWRFLRLTIQDNTATLSVRNDVVNRTNTANTTVFNAVPLTIDALNVAGQVGFRADNNNINALWNHVQIASMETAFVLQNDMFRIQTGANGNLQSLQVLGGTNWGRLQRDKTQVGLAPSGTGSVPIELLQNDSDQPAMGGRHRSLGDMRFNYQVGTGAWQTASTSNSGDSRIMWQQDNTIGVEYATPSANQRDGIRDFSVSQTFSVGTDELSGDYIHFDFEITNTTDEAITIRDMSLPMMWNNHWFEAGGGQASNAYATYLSNARNYVSLHGSYIMLERMDGASSKVVLVMDPDTNAKLEYRRYEAQHDNYSANMMEEFFIYSVGVAALQTNSSGAAINQSYLPNTQLVLQPGESSRYGFRIFHIDDYPDLHQLLHDQGLVSAVINPGTVAPMEMEIEVAVYSQTDVFLSDITPLPGGAATWFTNDNRDEWGATFRHIRDRYEDGVRIQIWGITFNKLGRNDIQINFQDGTRHSVMQFWTTEPIGDAIQRHADFIMDHKWISPEMQAARLAVFAPNTGHSGTGYRDVLSNFVRDHLYGFLEFHNGTGVARTGTGNGFACINSDYEQYYDAANFLAEKNITMPVRREIQALELYFTQLSYPKNIQPFGGYVDNARVRTDNMLDFTGANAARTGAPSNNTYREGVLTVKCCWQTNGFRMGAQSTTGAVDSAASRGTMHVFDRGYNYFHIANQFFSMYQVIRNNPHVVEYLQSDWDAVDYLRVAGIVAAEGQTMMRGFGKMGESTMFEIYSALRREYDLGNHGTFTRYNPTAEMQPLVGGGMTPLAAQGQPATTNAVIADRLVHGLNASTGVTHVSNAVANASGILSKANNFSMTNPYGSEFWVDNTSEEGVYFLTVNFGTSLERWNPATFAEPDVWSLPERVVDKMLGWTGMQPLWYHESTSRPMGPDWWNFQYTVGMQGAAIQHWFFNLEPDTDRANAMWSNIYSSQFATFVGIQSGQPEIGNGPTTTPAATAAQMAGIGPNEDIPRQGVGAMGSQWFVNRPTRPYQFGEGNNFPYGQTGEGGLLLWGGLRILSTDVVPNDPHFGLTAYGGTVELVNDTFVVVPNDGLQRRLNVVGQRLQARLLSDSYLEARIRTDFMGIEFDIDSSEGIERDGTITITNLVSGVYNVYVDGVLLEEQVVVENILDRNGLALPTFFTYPAANGRVQTIRIINEEIDIAPELPVLSFNTFNNGNSNNQSLANLGVIRMWTQLDGNNSLIPFAELDVKAVTADGRDAMEFVRINRIWNDLDNVNLFDIRKDNSWQTIYLTATLFGRTVEVTLINDLYVPQIFGVRAFNNGDDNNVSLANLGVIRIWTQINGVNTLVPTADLSFTAIDQDGNDASQFVRVNAIWNAPENVNLIDVRKNGADWQTIDLTLRLGHQTIELRLINNRFGQ